MIEPTTKRRILLPLVVLSLLIGLGATPSNAGRRSHYSFSIGFRSPYYHHGYGGYYGYGSYYGYGGYYGPERYYGPRYGGYARAGYPGTRVGAIDLKVKPKKTEIYVDGQYIGRSGQYDGYPGYLWLDTGTHELVFYRDGFRTFSRTFEVRGGMITRVVVEMEAGEASAPETSMSSGAGGREAQASRPPSASTPRLPVAGPERAPRGEVLDLRAEGGRIRVLVEPGDASIYLDGRFIGTGAELLRLHGGLMLDAGEHQIEALHPQYVSDRLSFRVKAGEDLELRLTLEVPAGT